MSTERVSLSHLERTAQEPREKLLHRVILGEVSQVNDRVRLLRLHPVPGEPLIKYLPGQWLDVHIPSVPKAGGFTITSLPSILTQATSSLPYVELAIQKSPSNPAAVFLWQPAASILGTELIVRVGGSFTWPPPSITLGSDGEPIERLERVVFVAGGVGINPLMAILSHLVAVNRESRKTKGRAKGFSFHIHILYTVRELDAGREKKVGEILFLDRLRMICKEDELSAVLKLFITSGAGNQEGTKMGIIHDESDEEIHFVRRRITQNDVLQALGTVKERSSTICYVCGPPSMTDELVQAAKEAEQMNPNHVFCEKWW